MFALWRIMSFNNKWIDYNKMYRFNLNPVIFLGTADNAIQNIEVNWSKQLLLQFKVMTILGCTPIIATPFIWQSQYTLNAISSCRDLLELEKGLKLIGKQNVETADEYYRLRVRETEVVKYFDIMESSPFKAEIPGATPLNWRKAVAPEIKLQYRPDSVETWFRRLFVEDTENYYDDLSIKSKSIELLSGKYSTIGRNKAEYLINKINERAINSHFSRAFVESAYFPTYNHNGVRHIINRTSALYQAANSIANNSALFTTDKILKYLPRSVQITAISPSKVSPLNPYIFTDVFSTIGVKREAWCYLNGQTIEKIINTYNPLSEFVILYKNFFLERLFHYSEKGIVPSYNLIVKELRRDLFLNNEWEFIERILHVNYSYTVGILAAVAANHLGYNPITVGAGAKRVVDFAQNFFYKTSFIEILKMRKRLKRYLNEIRLL